MNVLQVLEVLFFRIAKTLLGLSLIRRVVINFCPLLVFVIILKTIQTILVQTSCLCKISFYTFFDIFVLFLFYSSNGLEFEPPIFQSSFMQKFQKF